MKPIARLGDLHSCPKKGCGTTPIVSVASDSEVDGQRVATVGDKTGCGAVIVQGSSTMDVNGKPIAYVGCKTSHGGTIMTGSATCLVEP
ncbi:PAAR domain-containing protein [Neptunomonas phycophila]|uniref:PAAR domain-containing protein n=1 Tax=Neptunomonas phycophila TaxID=1572645 RepID=A0ABT9EVH9_9GAMM|nr:PAAR domain-containing protein [Neptunomonas phycophila]MDP2523076.1 PAAR domain-containing protein [Neptunomonas phycophila]